MKALHWTRSRRLFRGVRLLATILAAALLLLGSACGGSDLFGKDSDILIHLFRTDGSQDLTTYEIYMTKGGDTVLDTSDPEDFASTSNRPSWIDSYGSGRSVSELQLAFRTQSGQTPYYLFVRVPNTGAQFETLKLQIDVDSNQGQQRTMDLDVSTTQRLTAVRIDRNSATY